MRAPFGCYHMPLPPKGASAPLSATPFAPSLLGGEQMPEGGPHTEVGLKPKLSPRDEATKGVKLKSLHAVAQAVD